ncbi:MAG: trigger factor, partial [Henriciella sp.]
ELPPKMVESEFGQIWQQVQSELDAGRGDEEDKEKSEDELKSDYRAIAERRVRLGLVLAEIGQAADVAISENEVQQALIREAQNFPGQERQVIEFFQKNPNAMAQLRAPIYEDKVVDYILETAKVEDKSVDKDELLAEIEE